MINYDLSLWKTKKWLACNDPSKELVRVYLYQVQALNKFNFEIQEDLDFFVENLIFTFFFERICYELRENNLFKKHFCKISSNQCHCETVSLMILGYMDFIKILEEDHVILCFFSNKKK